MYGRPALFALFFESLPPKQIFKRREEFNIEIDFMLRSLGL
jgi:hypothetical protein